MGYKTRIFEFRIAKLTEELIKKSFEIKEKNRDITAGMQYAYKIQQAILPVILDNTFVLYMPKDIVSGDFYWMKEQDGKKIIATVDCTGHGVPAAFMSIIGYTSLNKIITDHKIIMPSEILDRLNLEVNMFLKQGLNDGMDISLIVFDNNMVEYAAANHSVYLVRDGEVTTYKGDRLSIGLATMQLEGKFTTKSFKVQPNDMIYMFTDGYSDQFSSFTNKKFQVNNVKKLLSQIWDMPLDKQRTLLEQEIIDWKDEEVQTDDITFVGTKII